MLCSLFMRLIVNDVMSRPVVENQNKVSVSNLSALLTPTYDNLTSADEVKLHQLGSLHIIIPNIFSNLHCDINNYLFSEYGTDTKKRDQRSFASFAIDYVLCEHFKMEGKVLFGRKNSHFIAFLVKVVSSAIGR